MKIEDLTGYFNTPVTVQLKDDWWAMQFVGQSPDGSLLCHAAMQTVEHPDTKQPVQAMVGRLNLLGPLVLKRERDAVVITHPGADGSLLETLCDPESILFVNRCVRAPDGRTRTPSILTP